MTVTYTFASLADLATWFEQTATERREAAERCYVLKRGGGKQKAEVMRAEAATWESAARLIRNTRVDPNVAPFTEPKLKVVAAQRD